ncbi:MAG: hypothetical protein A3H31_05670 [Gallionellales bacterium RIFCSPLOWO2_02_FULL_57_47]|nr:MAG: hypothetical protein A3H31_05670 [Gallionellales bacterium RIFCSPLOWO2_02_FULL_57_47]OGT13604.1 MAG: hypothetical protein A3J49_04430 [Gallionellales bacterium RIFCSPHIGHO2_02_FULL_57_16]
MLETQPVGRASARLPVIPQGYKQTEVGVIPEDWRVSEIGELNPFVTSGSRGWAEFYSEMGSPFIRITNMSRESIYLNLADLKQVKLPSHTNEGTRTQLQDDDVLISITADIGIASFVDGSVAKPAYINQHIALVRFDAEVVSSKFVAYFLASEDAQRRFRSATDQGAKAGMTLGGIKKIQLALPPEEEQDAIATALSDVDALLTKLDQLIAKKRDLKQAAMQQLLTGSTRLPGFSGEWEVKRLGEIAHIKTGSRNNEDKIEDGAYPFFVRSPHVERINSYSHECEAILVPGEGNIGNIFHYINGRFDVHQRVYAITQFTQETSGKYVYFYMDKNFGSHAMQNSVKATVDSLRLPTFQKFEIAMPPTYDEQTAIATILSDMDAEIDALEARRAKTRDLKQGMMQELLNGRIRLV